MKLLLDTHIALLAVSDDPRLSPKARELIATPCNLIWMSAVSIWEIAINLNSSVEGFVGANLFARSTSYVRMNSHYKSGIIR